jgi:L-ascorbate metabolism protein UlaG (beta-lactamase superfamily)
MDAKKAAELVNEIKPEVAIPTHYGNIVGKKEDGDHFSGLVKAPVRVDLKMEY